MLEPEPQISFKGSPVATSPASAALRLSEKVISVAEKFRSKLVMVKSKVPVLEPGTAVRGLKLTFKNSRCTSKEAPTFPEYTSEGFTKKLIFPQIKSIMPAVLETISIEAVQAASEASVIPERN